MPANIDKFSKFLMGAAETTEGVNPGELKLYRTRNLQPSIYAGDKKKRQYDGDDGRNTPSVTANQHNIFSFDTDFAGSGDASTIPAIDDLLRMAGLSRVANATAGFDYLISNAADTDSGTLIVRKLVGDGSQAGTKRYYSYESNGVKGYVGIQCQVNEDPMFQFRDMMGSYVRPVDSNEVGIPLIYTDQADPIVFGNSNVPLAQLGDPHDGAVFHDVCLHAFAVPNYSGFTVSRSNAVNCSTTAQQATAIDGTMTIKMPDWTSEFHVYELGESHSQILTVPLKLQVGTSAGNTLRVESEKVQVHGVNETDLDDGSVGVELAYTFLDKPVLTIQ